MNNKDKIRPLTLDEVIHLSAKAVDKIDLLGPRGTTLCSMEEIEAMACLITLGGLLPDAKQRHEIANSPKFKSVRKSA